MHARQMERREWGKVGFVFDIRDTFSDKRQLLQIDLPPKKSKLCYRQKGKADHVSQPYFSQFSLDVMSTSPHKPSQCASSWECSLSAELSVRDRGESARFLHFFSIAF